jgi:Protein of unknown function (DUF3551)
MRTVTTLAVIAAALSLTAHATPARATEYPWCARYDIWSYNCGFTTFGQCQATISGAGGICERNPRAVALDDAPRPRSARRKHAH